MVERLTDRPRDEHPDRAALERLARFDPDFHIARLAEAESANDDFAAAFHLRWLSAAQLSEADAAKWEQHARQAVLRRRNALTLHRHGVALYRAGKHAQAAQVLAESVKAQGKEGLPETWLFQALAAQKQGQHAEAVALLARFEAWHQKQTFADFASGRCTNCCWRRPSARSTPNLPRPPRSEPPFQKCSPHAPREDGPHAEREDYTSETTTKPRCGQRSEPASGCRRGSWWPRGLPRRSPFRLQKSEEPQTRAGEKGPALFPS